jgi:hypothetical protein
MQTALEKQIYFPSICLFFVMVKACNVIPTWAFSERYSLILTGSATRQRMKMFIHIASNKLHLARYVNRKKINFQ